MKNNRRDFIKLSTLTGVTLAGGNLFSAFGSPTPLTKNNPSILNNQQQQSLIGQYGPWAVGENAKALPSHSFRNPKWKNHKQWQAAAKKSNAGQNGHSQHGTNTNCKAEQRIRL